MASSKFFGERQGAAVLKHGILRRYVAVFLGKLGSTHDRVAYLDAYAGGGTYASGAKGSPLLVADIAEHMKAIRNLDCYLVERKADHCAQLEKAVEGVDSAFVYQGRIEQHLDEVLKACSGMPLFAFFDPFGLPPPMALLKEKVLERSGVTELLVNITLPGIWRNAGHLKDPTTNHAGYLAARPRLVGNMNEAFGGDWWQEIWKAGTPDRAHEIFLGYVERLRTGWSFYWTEVPKTVDGAPIYYLLLLTRHRDGLWEFNGALSKAFEDLQRFNADVEGGEQLSFLDRDAELSILIEANLRPLLEVGQPFTPVGKMREVFGTTAGQAREKHLRRALRVLEAEGSVPQGTSKGDLEKKWIKPS